ncbi:MAG: hypothetical protein HYS87_03220 [Candidatus Colwellbacteria bacterium]|nr:hypothetical protein [Candidatus Colwellbacteria bacterium]
MKKILISVLVGLALVGGASAVYAQEADLELPAAGLTPESLFYFLDKWAESVREFFTFGAEGKAKLQIKFAAERVAEVKLMIETKGANAKGLDQAKERFEVHLKRAADIVEKEKQKGKDVSEFANEINQEFHQKREEAKAVFETALDEFHIQKDELKEQIKAAKEAGDAELIETLKAELEAIEAEKDAAEELKDKTIDALEAEKDKLEDDLDDDDLEEDMEMDEEDARSDAEEEISEAQDEKQELIEEAKAEGVELAADSFMEFDSLIAQAKTAFNAGDFEEAERLAKEADDSFEKVKNIIDEAEDEDDEDKDDEDKDDEDEDDEDENEEESDDDEDDE